MATKGPLAIGVDLGGTNINAAVVDHAGNALSEPVHGPTPVPCDPGAVFDAIAQLAGTAAVEAGVELSDVEAIGLATPGALDPARYTITLAPNLGWTDVEPVPALRERLPVRAVAVENDVNAALYAEARLGAAVDATDALAVWLGTGIGGGLLRAGRIDVGPTGSAGEIGQLPTPGLEVDPANPEATWLERHASRAAVAQAIARETGEDARSLTAGVIAERYKAGDAHARAAADAAADRIAPAVAGVCTVLGITTVVLGGGMGEHMPRAWLDRLRERTRACAHPPPLAEALTIVRTTLGPRAGLTGAALLAFELAETN